MANQTPLELYVGDERPDWVETLEVNGVLNDYSTGYTFSLTITNAAGTALLNDETGWTTGGPNGVLTTVWVGADLLAAGVTATALQTAGVRFTCYLTVSETAESADETVVRPLIMKWRP